MIWADLWPFSFFFTLTLVCSIKFFLSVSFGLELCNCFDTSPGGGVMLLFPVFFPTISCPMSVSQFGQTKSFFLGSGKKRLTNFWTLRFCSILLPLIVWQNGHFIELQADEKFFFVLKKHSLLIDCKKTCFLFFGHVKIFALNHSTSEGHFGEIERLKYFYTWVFLHFFFLSQEKGNTVVCCFLS